LRRTTTKPFDGRQPDRAASLGPANTRCVALQYLALCGVFDLNGDARTRRGNSPWVVLAPPDAPRSAAAAAQTLRLITPSGPCALNLRGSKEGKRSCRGSAAASLPAEAPRASQPSHVEGAGGDALSLLQKSGISEGKGYGVDPINRRGIRLVSDAGSMIRVHLAGATAVASPRPRSYCERSRSALSRAPAPPIRKAYSRSASRDGPCKFRQRGLGPGTDGTLLRSRSLGRISSAPVSRRRDIR